MKWSTSRQNTRRVREKGRAQGGAGRGERRVMWRDLVLESGAGLSNAAKCRLRKSEWTLLAFADGSKLFVATRDLSPTIFHFKEKWKQLFDLGILGAPREGVGRGEGTGAVGKGGRSGRSKSEQRPWRGGGEDGEAAENKRRVREAGACVCVCVRACLPLCLSPHGLGPRTRGYLVCVLDPWAAGGGWGGETGEGRGGRRGPPSPAPGWLNSIVHRGGGRWALQAQSLTRAGWGRERREGGTAGTGRGGRGAAGAGEGSTSVMPKGMLPT